MSKIFNSNDNRIVRYAEVVRNRGETLESFERRKAKEEAHRKRNEALTERKRQLPGGVWNAPVTSPSVPLGPPVPWEMAKEHMGPDPILNISVEDIMQQMREEINHQPERFAINLPTPSRRKKTGSIIFNAAELHEFQLERRPTTPSESTTDEQDPEQMSWGVGTEPMQEETKGKPWLNNNDLIDEDDSTEDAPHTEVCPECNSDSILNAKGNEVYKDHHCENCDKTCGSDVSRDHHCKGCQHQSDVCPGKPQVFWGKSPKDFCHTCHNLGLVSHDIRPKGNEEDNSEDAPQDTTVPSSLPETREEVYKMERDAHPQARSFGDDDDDYPDDNVVKYNTDVASALHKYNPAAVLPNLKNIVGEDRDVSGLHRALSRDIEGLTKGPGGLDDPELLDKFEQEGKRIITTGEEDEEPEIAENKNEKMYSGESHNPWCKCKGTGLIQDPNEIAKIQGSGEFEDGIAAINKKFKGSSDLDDAKNTFMLDQLKCKEM